MIQTAEFWIVVGASVVAFWLSPRALRYGLLALISWVYLFWFTVDVSRQTGNGNPYVVPMLTGWVALFYWLAPKAMGAAGWTKRITPMLILAVLGVLIYFKYIPPLIDAVAGDRLALQIALPLGISYYSFKLIHYAVEVGRGNIRQRSLSRFACYMFLFPIFTAGPIERYDHFQKNLEPRWSAHMTAWGLSRIMSGLIKQFVIAEMVLRPQLRSYATAEAVLARIDELPSYAIWGYCVLTYLITYMDFSAYSDIAIGTSRLFGIRIMENFNWPVLASNIGVFWKRWHMTLAGWCQSYVYMPMIGLTRNPYLAVYTTFLVMGLWHAGSTVWVMWGLYHGTLVTVYLQWSRMRRKWKWRPSDRILAKLPGIGITFIAVSVASAITTNYPNGTGYDAVRMLAKLIWIDLPA